MNFLAHLYLSGTNTKLMTGNFMGDFVKGRNLYERYETDIARGIELHRAIDEYTDTHPIVLKSKTRLRADYRHYAPVIVDVFYDHFLSRYWRAYHQDSIEVYADFAYKTLESFGAILPDDARNMLPYMINGNWLVNYGQIEGIQQALMGMSRRSRFNPKMDESVANLRVYYAEYKMSLKNFFLC